MTRKAYLPEEDLFGIKTVVTDKSEDGLPNWTSREPETNLPPGAATPMSVRKEDTADGNGRVLSSDSPSYNTPGTGEPGPFEHPRTTGVPGEQEGSPTKFDYNMPTRRTMTSAEKEAYKARIPWRRQRRQRVWDKLESKRDYKLNKSVIKHRAKIWYKQVRKNQQFKTKKENRRDNPMKYKRRRQGDTSVEGYTPTSLSTRRHRQHGPARMKSHRNYIRNRAKSQRRQHMWYQRNKNKPAFKRRQTMRRQHPQRFHMRPGAFVPEQGIGFMYGPGMTLGRVDSVSEVAIVFSPVDGGDALHPESLTPAAFLHAVVFDSEDSMHAMFAALDDEVGLEAYDDLTIEDVNDIAIHYGVTPPDLVDDEPDYLAGVADQIVSDAMDAWDDPSPMAVRVAARCMDALGEIILYDQGRPTSHDQAKVVERVVLDHEPTPGGYEKPEESGVSAPASSGKVIPDSMKQASHWQEEQEDDDHYYFLKTPDGNYIFRYFTTWEGEEKPTGNLVWTGGDFGEENIGEFTLDEAKRRADKHYQTFRAEKAAEVAEEKKERTLREQLLDFADDFRKGTGDYKIRYEMLIQQAFALGMIDENLRKKLNRHNKQVSSLKSGPVSTNELMAQGLEMIVRESKHDSLRTADFREVTRLGDLRAYWEYNSPSERYYGVESDGNVVGGIQWSRKSDSWVVVFLPEGGDGPKVRVETFTASDPREGVVRALQALRPKTRTAATISDIDRHVAADVAKRARSVKVSLSRADTKNGIWTFRAKGSEGKNYTIRVKAERKGNTKEVGKLQIKLSCDCDFFRFQGPEHWAKTNDYLYGKPRGTASAPTEKDASGQHWACKHAVAALLLARRYRVAGEGAWWPIGADVVPEFCGPSASRVAARYGGT